MSLKSSRSLPHLLISFLQLQSTRCNFPKSLRNKRHSNVQEQIGWLGLTLKLQDPSLEFDVRFLNDVQDIDVVGCCAFLQKYNTEQNAFYVVSANRRVLMSSQSSSKLPVHYNVSINKILKIRVGRKSRFN